MILAYIATQNEITEIKTTLEEEQAQMQELQTEYEAQQGILNTLIASKQEEVANFDSLLAQAYAAEEARQAAAAAGPAYYAYDEASGEYYYSNDGETFYSASGNVAYSEDFGSAIVAAALGQLGTPYQWGAQNPGYGFDCSGLVQYVYGQSGISIPRTSGEIFANGTIVTDPQPGDICWTPGHVGIYYGDGKMIHAPQDGESVSVSDAKATYYIRY